ncbi:hypothetical protein [Niabella hibiscisoli]|uniref:hypothetical protein n=1 Tax=Niabella hibiscisoli TaxID=1825928 RepID=UPI001F0DEA4C|nr:hypothetical protein [Niabella hibiscisoli]MCH5718376.1 hypothetical protein [Niabella hibiscisoli]
MIHITQKRFEQRANSLTDIKVFSNLPELVLMINGKYVATVKPDAFKTAVFSRVELQSGNNKIKVTGSGSYKNFKDECSWLVEGHGFIIRPLTQNSL